MSSSECVIVIVMERRGVHMCTRWTKGCSAHTKKKTSFDFGPHVGSGTSSLFRVWDVNTGQCLQTSSCCGSALASLAIGATVFASGNYDGKIQVWEVRQNRFWRFWQRWSSDV